MSRVTWILIVLAAFGVMFACSLTFVYVEGDDAVSIAYHALGRNAELQPPYSTYHAGMDLLLSFLPADESVLRITAISISSVAACLTVILMLALVVDWKGTLSSKEKCLAAIVVPLACPEFFYLGLIYTPTVVGMCFVLAAHLLLRKAIRRWTEGGSVARLSVVLCASAALFGLGAACRFDVVLYGGLIVADLAIAANLCHAGRPMHLARRVGLVAVWTFLTFGLWCAVIALSGYGLHDVMDALLMAKHLSTDAGFDGRWLVILVGTGQALFTPALLVIGLWGWFALPRRLRWLSLVSVAGWAAVVVLLKWHVPKMLLAFVPAFILCLVSGLQAMWFGQRRRTANVLLRTAVVLLVLAPWTIGIQVCYQDSAWGVEYAVLPFDRPVRSAGNIRVSIGAGAAFPTQEGPRPLFGHAAVLLGGRQRRFVEESARERRQTTAVASDADIPLLVLQGSTGYIVAEAVGKGFRTTEPQLSHLRRTVSGLRRFAHRDGRRLELMKLGCSVEELLDDPQRVQRVLDAAGRDRVVVYGYPSSLRAIYLRAAGALHKLGPRSARLDLRELLTTTRNGQAAETVSHADDQAAPDQRLARDTN